MKSLVLALTIALAGVFSIPSVAVASPVPPVHQKAVSAPVIPETRVFDAPFGKKGGISNPVVSCGDSWRVEPRVRWVLTNLDTGAEKTYRWRGIRPNIAYPRVWPGEYQGHTIAYCKRRKAEKTEQLTVGEKTHETTVSRGEWRKIRRGMTAAQVKRIVGYGGVTGGRYQGRVTRTYDMMAFWRWSNIEYRRGRVVEKWWNVGHD